MRENDRDRNFWERKARQYDRVAKGWLGRPLPRVLELTAAAVSGAETVLEAAAGTGLMTAVIAPRVRRVVATDYADNMLAILRERMKSAGISNVAAERRDIYALGYPPGSFDVVVAGNVLHLVPDLGRALDACARSCVQAARSSRPPSFTTRRRWHGSRLACSQMCWGNRCTAASRPHRCARRWNSEVSGSVERRRSRGSSRSHTSRVFSKGWSALSCCGTHRHPQGAAGRLVRSLHGQSKQPSSEVSGSGVTNRHPAATRTRRVESEPCFCASAWAMRVAA